jgi:hypothetical protein
MKFVLLLLLSSFAQADVIISGVVKDGPNGYIANGSVSSSSTKTTSTTTNTFNVSNRIEMNPGLQIQYLPKESPIVFGIGGFSDSTLEALIGIRL